MKPDFHLHTNITPGQSIDFQRDFMHAFAADIRAACADIPPVLIPNKKLATVLPFPTARRPVSTSVTKPTEVPSCSNAICPNPTSVG